MKKNTLIYVIAFFISTITIAQGTLQFNQVLTVTNTPQTVPAGKVWKVMSVYGKPADQCTLDPLNIWTGAPNEYWKYKAKGFQVNGNTVWMNISEAVFDIKQCADCNCANYTDRAWSDAQALKFKNEVGHQTADDLRSILPFWMAAGSSINSMSATQFISIIEFNIIP